MTLWGWILVLLTLGEYENLRWCCVRFPHEWRQTWNLIIVCYLWLVVNWLLKLVCIEHPLSYKLIVFINWFTLRLYVIISWWWLIRIGGIDISFAMELMTLWGWILVLLTLGEFEIFDSLNDIGRMTSAMLAILRVDAIEVNKHDFILNRYLSLNYYSLPNYFCLK